MAGEAKFNQSRKEMPLFSGVLMYFPDALLEVAKHSKRGNDKHNPNQPLHWARDKSKDQADCIARHLVDIGPKWDGVDPETGSFHAAALAWRSLALLQIVLENQKDKTNKELENHGTEKGSQRGRVSSRVSKGAKKHNPRSKKAARNTR
jgi:hypothetical protein